MIEEQLHRRLVRVVRVLHQDVARAEDREDVGSYRRGRLQHPLGLPGPGFVLEIGSIEPGDLEEIGPAQR